MPGTDPGNAFSLSGKAAVVTGATGTLGGAMARGLSRAGARVGVLGRREEKGPRRSPRSYPVGAQRRWRSLPTFWTRGNWRPPATPRSNAGEG